MAEHRELCDVAAEEEADRVQAALGHRRVILPAGSTDLEDGFRRLGWKPDHFLFMVYRGGGEPADTTRVEEVEPGRLRRLRDEIIREWQPDAGEMTVSEIGRASCRERV